MSPFDRAHIYDFLLTFYSNYASISRVVSEIINVEKYRDLDPVKGHSRSLTPTRIDPPPMTTY